MEERIPLNKILKGRNHWSLKQPKLETTSLELLLFRFLFLSLSPQIVHEQLILRLVAMTMSRPFILNGPTLHPLENQLTNSCHIVFSPQSTLKENGKGLCFFFHKNRVLVSGMQSLFLAVVPFENANLKRPPTQRKPQSGRLPSYMCFHGKHLKDSVLFELQEVVRS